MLKLTEEQKDIRHRLQQAVEQEIGMCDGYPDLMVLASFLFDASKNIFSIYAKDHGTDALEQAMLLVKRSR